MNEYVKVGFLSSELENFERILKKKFPEHYDCLLKANRFSQQLQYMLKIDKTNSDEIAAAILFSRTLATYQAFILIAKRGMNQQARMLLRCMFESLFPLAAISKHKGYSLKLIGSEENERLKAFNKLLRYHRRNNPNNPVIRDIENKAREVREIIKKHGYRKLTIAQCAEDAGLIDWYDTAYPHLSSTVHASVRSLEDSLVLDPERNLKELKNEPEIDEFDDLFATAIEVMEYAVIAISNIFGVDVNSFLKEISEKLKDFARENA